MHRSSQKWLQQRAQSFVIISKFSGIEAQGDNVWSQIYIHKTARYIKYMNTVLPI